MKKALTIVLLIALLLTMLPTAGYAEDCVYLSDLTFKACEHQVSANWPSIDKIKATGKPLAILGQSYTKGVAIHPTATDAAYISYDISSYAYDSFMAVIGKDDVNLSSITSDTVRSIYYASKVTYTIYFDGVSAFNATLTGTDKQEIVVNIPTGTKEIKLEVGNGGDGHSYDGSDFAMARLCNDDGQQTGTPTPTPGATPNPSVLSDNGTYKPDFSKKYVYLSDMNYSDYHAFVGSSGAYIMRDKNVRNERLYTVTKSYEKGICMHADMTTKAFVEFDVKGLGYTVFASYLGAADTKAADTSMASVSFTVYVDGKEAYTSGKIVHGGEDELVSVDITGASKLKIEIDSLGSNAGDWGILGNAVIGKYKSAQAVYEAIEAEKPTPTPTTTADPNAGKLADNGTYKPDFTKNYVFLSDMNYSDYHAFVGTNGAYISRDKNIRGERLYTLQSSYDKGICMHADMTTKAFVEFDIKGLGYTVFAANLGIADSAQADTSMGSVEFIIYVDGKETYKSGKLTGTDEEIIASVNISGASKLKIEIDCLGTNSGDWGLLGDAAIGKFKTADEMFAAIKKDRPAGDPTREKLFPDNGSYTPDFTKNYVYLSDMNYSDYHAFVGSKGAYIKRDENVYEEDLFTVANIYKKGICMHADATRNVYVEFDIKDLGFTVFATYLGIADSFGADTSMASAEFIVYVDGNEVYKSGKMVQGCQDQLLSIDITGASKLKIALDSLGGNSGDWGVLGSAAIGKFGTAEEVFAAIEADKPITTPKPKPTETPGPQNTPAPTNVATETPGATENGGTNDDGGSNPLKTGLIIAGITLITVAAVAVAMIIIKKSKGKK